MAKQLHQCQPTGVFLELVSKFFDLSPIEHRFLQELAAFDEASTNSVKVYQLEALKARSGMSC